MKARYWTRKEVEQLKSQFGKVPIGKIAKSMNRTAGSVRWKAQSLDLTGDKGLWTSEDDKFLRENYLRLGAEETAKRLGRTKSAVHTRIRQVGGGRKSIGSKVEWTQDELDYLRENYQIKSLEEIARHLSRTENAIHRRASMIELQHYIEPFPFFENWTEESAYVVGFWAADGWVTKRGTKSIRIGFAQKDVDIILKLQELLPMGRVTCKATGMHQFYVQSVKVYEWLCEIFEHDVCQKSHTLQWPKVPDEFIRHFIRGAVDGDGSLFKTNEGYWGFSYATSSRDFIDAFAQVVFDKVGVNLSVRENKIGVWHARVTGVGATCLADWLYRDANIALERKEWIAREMMEARGFAYKRNVTPKMLEVFPHIFDRYEIV